MSTYGFSYAKYYFDLRTLSKNASTFPLQPLTTDGTGRKCSLSIENLTSYGLAAELLEARSRGAERKLAEAKKERRTRSLESVTAAPVYCTLVLQALVFMQTEPNHRNRRI